MDEPVTPAPPSSDVKATVEMLRRFAPFDRMRQVDLDFLAAHARSAAYLEGAVLGSPDGGPPTHLTVLTSGRVRGEVAAGGGAPAAAWELTAGECFPLGALLEKRAAYATHRVAEDVTCLELPAEDFAELFERSDVFREFATRRMADLLAQSMRQMHASLAARVSGDTPLGAPLRSLIRRRPVSCPLGTPIREVLRIMDGERVGSMVVVDAGESPAGIFTLHDVLSRVAVPAIDQAGPIDAIMTPQPATLGADQLAHDAALVMASKGFGHVVVVERGRLAGVVSERDLFALQRVGVVNLSRAIGKAPDVASLARFGNDIHRLADQMLAQGASVEQLTQMIATLNDLLTRRAIELCLARCAPLPEFTWLAFGSEGRHEQTLRTDQDNGIVFRVPAGQTAAGLRTTLLPTARKINEALADCGFDLCPGNIMASNPECCLSVEEWRERFAQWIEQGTPDHLLKASIFFDFRALWGDEAVAEELRDWVMERVPRNPRFRRQMAANALRNEPPLGLIQDFVVSGKGDRAGTLDLKLSGTTPFVDGARILALSCGARDTNTIARLRACAEKNAIRADEAAAWSDAYAFVLLQRMRTHQAQQRAGRRPDNRLAPADLNELDRRILKESFRQARKLQSRLAMDYQLRL
jgi:CBS domain-containing protein